MADPAAMPATAPCDKPSSSPPAPLVAVLVDAVDVDVVVESSALKILALALFSLRMAPLSDFCGHSPSEHGFTEQQPIKVGSVAAHVYHATSVELLVQSCSRMSSNESLSNDVAPRSAVGHFPSVV